MPLRCLSARSMLIVLLLWLARLLCHFPGCCSGLGTRQLQSSGCCRRGANEALGAYGEVRGDGEVVEDLFCNVHHPRPCQCHQCQRGLRQCPEGLFQALDEKLLHLFELKLSALRTLAVSETKEGRLLGIVEGESGSGLGNRGCYVPGGRRVVHLVPCCW